MICPRCKVLLRSSAGKDDKLAFWECGKCSGRVLQASTTRQFLDEKLNRWLWELAQNGDVSLDTRCPRCQRFMRKAVLQSGNDPVEVDACVTCKCIWFDNGEIEQLLITPTDASSQDEVSVEMTDDPMVYLQAVLSLPVPEEGFKWNDIVSWTACAIGFVSVVCFKHLEWAVTHLGFTPALALHEQRYTWISSIFVHANWGHLLGNLYFLFIVGAAVQEYLQADGFLMLLAFSSLAGNLAVYCMDPQSSIIQIGASGGICGVMAYFALKFPNKRISIARAFGWQVFRFHMSAWVAFLLFLGLQITNYMGLIGGQDNSVSYLSHLGGSVAGFIYYLVF